MKVAPDASFILDSSVALVWVFEDETDPWAMSVLDAMTGWTAVVPSLFFWEVTNVLIGAVRKNRIPLWKAQRFVEKLKVLNFEVVASLSPETSRTLFNFALAMGLTAYDAQYLLLAQTLDLSLATLNKEILAAMTALSIPRFEP